MDGDNGELAGDECELAPGEKASAKGALFSFDMLFNQEKED